MRKSTIILFFLGLALESFIFFVSQAEQIPWVLRLVSPMYSQGMQGIEKLDANESLFPGDIGFAEISHLIMLDLQNSNPPERLRQIEIRELQPGGGPTIGGIKRKRFKVVFSNGQEMDCWLGSYREKFADPHSGRLFRIARAIFVVGVVLQLVGFGLQWKESRDKRLEVPSEVSVEDTNDGVMAEGDV